MNQIMRKKLRVKNLKPQRRYGGLGVRRVPAVPGSYLGPGPPPPHCDLRGDRIHYMYNTVILTKP